MHLDALLPQALSRQLTPAQAALNIAHVAHDSRRCQPHTLFAAWRGERSDGHAHVAAAVQNGAAFVLSQKSLGEGVAHLVCDDPRRVLAGAAARLYADRVAPLVRVGITGTNGKTTCAHLVASILAAHGGRAVAIGTLGESRLTRGQPIAIRALPGNLTTPEAADLQSTLAAAALANAAGAAVEVTSIALHQGRIAHCRFSVAAMTNLTQDHLDVHGTMEAYGAAKARLFREHLDEGATCVLNAGDPFVRSIPTAGHEVIWFGQDPHARGAAGPVQVAPREARLARDGMQLWVQTPRGELAVRSPLVGDFNVDNVLLAIAVGEALGLPHAAVQEGIADMAAVPGRLERFGGTDLDPLVLVDYAHTPDALERTLKVARTLTPVGQLVCVFGCGGDRDTKKRAPMGRIAAALADRVIVTNDNPRGEAPETIADAICSGIEDEKHAVTVELDRARAIALAVGEAQPGDTVLVAGKGHETYQIVGAKTHSFDDRGQVGKALAQRARQRAQEAGNKEWLKGVLNEEKCRRT